MRIDVQKIDERIKKLQELRRIATDPELSTMLGEFVSAGEQGLETTPAPAPPLPLRTAIAPVDATSPEITNQIVNEVVNGHEGHSGSGLFNRRGR